MAIESKLTRAIYAGGVFRPVEPVDVPENSEVDLVVYPQGGWATVAAIMARIHARTRLAAAGEIEADVREAVREVRTAARASDASRRP